MRLAEWKTVAGFINNDASVSPADSKTARIDATGNQCIAETGTVFDADVGRLDRPWRASEQHAGDAGFRLGLDDDAHAAQSDAFEALVRENPIAPIRQPAGKQSTLNVVVCFDMEDGI